MGGLRLRGLFTATHLRSSPRTPLYYPLNSGFNVRTKSATAVFGDAEYHYACCGGESSDNSDDDSDDDDDEAEAEAAVAGA